MSLRPCDSESLIRLIGQQRLSAVPRAAVPRPHDEAPGHHRALRRGRCGERLIAVDDVLFAQSQRIGGLRAAHFRVRLADQAADDATFFREAQSFITVSGPRNLRRHFDLFLAPDESEQTARAGGAQVEHAYRVVAEPSVDRTHHVQALAASAFLRH